MTRTREAKQQSQGASSDTIEAERKKQRNRLSQKAFRNRQAEYIRELENRVAGLSKSDDERVAELEEENKSLRSQLLNVNNKLESVQVTLQTLTNTISGALNLSSKSEDEVEVVVKQDSSPEPQNTVETKGREQSLGLPESGQNATTENFYVVPGDPLSPNNVQSTSSMGFIEELPSDGRQAESQSQSDNLALNSLMDQSGAEPSWGLTTYSNKSPSNLQHQSPVEISHIPNTWTFEYQMGPEAYTRAFNASQDTSTALEMEWTPSNSPFSEHLTTLYNCLRGKWQSFGMSLSSRPEIPKQSVSMVLSMFNSVARPEAMMWYAKTRFYHIVDFAVWQLRPSQEAYERIHPRYRPTNLQLSGNYPCIIDWLPFASIRDKLILFHSANPYIDNIFSDCVASYSVEGVLSDLIIGAPPTPIYARILDFVIAMGNKAPRSTPQQQDLQLPVADLNMLFESPHYARLAFKKLKMDKDLSNYKLDPLFFRKYPELFDPTSGVMARGVSLKPPAQVLLPVPKPLDAQTVGVYRSFTDFSLSMLWNTFPQR
ncbi:hypothetical protein AAFC00_002420 [Neodothiora populina]|uniref:BZIP domain-containing protein n=1 Tax=Neodothiora populina TaxID=2781224 RepID=A0ABR3P705_9PEZI